MNLTIKTLEEIGQNSSLKDYDNLHEMLSSLDIEGSSIGSLNLLKKEFVCGLIPEDDSEGDNEEQTDK